MRKIFLILSICLIIFGRALASSKPRYISLAPSTTEILFALGLNDEVVGVSSYCNYPKEAQSKERVGTFSQPNIEKIVFLKPDYVFCTGLEQAQAIIELKRLKMNVYVADPVNINELLETISDIAKITNRSMQAKDIIKQMQGVIIEITQKVSLVPVNNRPKVFIEVWHDPLSTAGIGSFVDELITMAGGVNIASNTKRAYSNFSPEEVIKRDPDYIFLAYMDKQPSEKLFKERFGWQGIKAVKNNHVYSDIDPDILLRPGPRVILGLKEIHKRLYP